MVPLAASPHPLGVSVLAKPRYGGKGLVMNTETCSSHTYHSEIIRVLEALCQELGTDQVCVSSCITVSQVHSVPVTCHCQCCPWPPGWHGVCQSSADEGTLSSFPPVLLGRTSWYGAHTWGMGSDAPPLGGQSVYISYLEFFCIGDSSVFSIYLFSHIYLTDSWLFSWHFQL